MKVPHSSHLRPGPAVLAALTVLAAAVLPAELGAQGVEAVDPEEDEPAEQRREDVWLGVEIDSDASEREGAPVRRVLDDSPAARAGLEDGDRILAVGGVEVDDLASVREQLRSGAPGDEVEIRYARNGSTQTTRVTLSLRPSERELREQRRVGEPLPDSVELQPVGESGESASRDDGGTSGEAVWTRASLRGKPVVLEFWATWCAPCRETAETLESLKESFGERVRFVGVSRESEETLEAHLREQEPSYTIVRDLDDSAHDALFISGYPTIVVLDADGRVVEYFSGLGHENALRELLEDRVDE